MTTINLTPRLRLAAGALREHGWTTGTERDDAGRMCLTGAIRYCAPQNGDEYLIREVLRKRGRAEDWNDHRATEAEVLDLLDTAEVTDDDLEDTFGPQWYEIVALVRRGAALTPEETGGLYLALDAARYAARYAAWDAALDAALDAARDAALDAAGDAARDAAQYAAQEAATALALRDLIGQHGFTQAHYDTLTGPWRKVIGKVHPDDTDFHETATKATESSIWIDYGDGTGEHRLFAAPDTAEEPKEKQDTPTSE